MSSPPVSTARQRIAEQARRDPALALMTLAHLMAVDLLREAYHQTRRAGAPGIDGVTAAAAAANLAATLTDWPARWRNGRYDAPPGTRTYVPQEDGSQRPIGLPACEDKIVQRAVARLLGAISEQDVRDGSSGLRDGRSPHQALHVWRARCLDEPLGWMVDAAVSAFFDSLDHEPLCEVLTPRVKDGAILRLIRKWQKAGVVEGETLSYPARGSPQGGGIAPMRAHMFLDHVLDDGLEREVRARLQGRCVLIRYGEDFVIGGEREEAARRMRAVLPRRFARLNLAIHPQKTRLGRFQPPRSQAAGASGDGTFDVLGLTHDGGRSRRGVLGDQAADGQAAAAACAARGVALVPHASARTDTGAVPDLVPDAPGPRPVRRPPGALPEAGRALPVRGSGVALLAAPAWWTATDPVGEVRQTACGVGPAPPQDRAPHLMRPAGLQLFCIRVVPTR